MSVAIILIFHVSSNKSNNDKKVLNLKSYTKSNSYLFFTRTINLCFKQIISNSTFKSALTMLASQNHNKVVFKSCWIIYLVKHSLF